MSSILRTMRREMRHRRGLPRGGWGKPAKSFKKQKALERFWRRVNRRGEAQGRKRQIKGERKG